MSVCQQYSLIRIISHREDQAQGRFHRIGQTKPTWFMTIIVEDTIDGDVVECKYLLGPSLYQHEANDFDSAGTKGN
jgi:hypothetical protein